MELIKELKVTKYNFNRLKRYIEFFGWDDEKMYEAYDVLILRFGKFMTDKERRELIKKGRRIFGADRTVHWSFWCRCWSLAFHKK